MSDQFDGTFEEFIDQTKNPRFNRYDKVPIKFLYLIHWYIKWWRNAHPSEIKDVDYLYDYVSDNSGIYPKVKAK
jgi:hypothetical protein